MKTQQYLYLLCLPLLAMAGSRTSTDYTIITDTLDAGGGTSFGSFTYAQVGSVGATHGTAQSLAGGATNYCGYIGQLEAPLFRVADMGTVLLSHPASIGEGMSYSNTVTVSNGGPDQAGQVVLALTWPSDVAFVSASSPLGGWSRSGNILTWNVGVLSNGLSATLTLVLTSATQGDRVSVASVQGAVADPDGNNNPASVTTRVLALNSDEDADGLSYSDEISRGTNPILRDTDGDGASDGDEVAAGTDPLNRASLLTFIALTPAVDGLNVTWQGGTQVTQLLQRITCLAPLTVQSVFTNLPPMALTNTYFDIKGTNTMLFYRLQILR